MSWNRQDSEKEEKKRKHSGGRFRVPLVLLVPAVLLLCGIAAWWAVRGGGRSGRAIQPAAPRHAGGQIAEATPATGTNSPTTKAAATTPTNTVQKRMEEGVEVVSSTITTNTSGAVIEKLLLADGKKMMKVYPPKPVFANACDQVIAMAISAKPGQSMPPLPNLDKSLEQDFIDSLGSPIVINEDDSDDVKLIKAQVKEAKAYLVEEIKRGGSLLEILREHQAAMERNADNHLMAIQEMEKLRAESGEQAARDFIKAVNESFKVRGIPEIELKDNQGTNERN